jgi:carbon-monoxide dehydrogenase small subunit
MSKHQLKLRVNGKDYAAMVDSHVRLIDVLRDKLGLRGTKEGCGTGDCGTCVVIMNGKLVNSCLVLAMQARGSSITTVEGIGTEEVLHPLQETFIESGASQCGYCIPGMLITAKHLLDVNPQATEDEVKEAISGVLCRCTGYTKIIKAIKDAQVRILKS